MLAVLKYEEVPDLWLTVDYDGRLLVEAINGDDIGVARQLLGYFELFLGRFEAVLINIGLD